MVPDFNLKKEKWNKRHVSNVNEVIYLSNVNKVTDVSNDFDALFLFEVISNTRYGNKEINLGCTTFP